jgi:Protein of unknown function (DUF4238)
MAMTLSMAMADNNQRGRKDHYIPQGYLSGFINPARKDLAKPFWKFDLETNLWSMESPGSVGWERGFYDTADASVPQEHPDVTFGKFEREFSQIREHLLGRNYKGWVKQHKTFLLGYMQMMRARSPLFIEKQTEHNRSLRGATVTSAGPGNQVTVDSLELRPFSESVVRNAVISQMQQEINKGPDWMRNFEWCLRYTRSIDDPFVTGQQPIVLEGPAPNSTEAMTHLDTLIWFPICWQACLIGSLRRFDEGTMEAPPSLLAHARGLFKRPSTGYLISPHKLSDDMFDVGDSTAA